MNFVKEGYSDPLARPFYEKISEWESRNSVVWKEFELILTKAEEGEFK